MAKLYNQYCYDKIADVKDSIRSQMSIEGFGIVQNVTSSAGVITVEYLDSSSLLNNYTFTPPSCINLGYDNSYTGITTADAVEIGSLVTLALVVAYAIKITRRAL